MTTTSDSHTTLCRGGTEEQDEVESITSSVDLLASPSSQGNDAAPSPAASQSSQQQDITSPSTQTLNILSQHDAMGGGNLRYNKDNMDRDALAVTASQQVVLSEKDEFSDWSMVTVALTQPGSLGMTVRRLTLQNPLRSYTIIKKVKAGSQADVAGVKVGDVVGARYEEVAKWGNGPRPVAFCVLRKPSDNRVQEKGASSAVHVQQQQNASTSKVAAHRPVAHPSSTTRGANVQPIKSASKPTPAPKIVTEQRPVDKDVTAATTTTENVVDTNAHDHQAAVVLAHKLATTILPQEPPRQQVDAAARVDKSVPAREDDILPFCKACQKSDSANRVHHALCPKHPQFDNSGALEKLELIRRGVQLGCEPCKLHYQHGRVVDHNRAHLDNCPRRKQPLRQNGEVLCVEETLNSPAKTLSNVQHSTFNKSSEPRSKGGAALKNDSASSGATKKGKNPEKKRSGDTKTKGTDAKKSSGRKSSGGRGSQSVTPANSKPGTEEIGPAIQETVGSIIASATDRRPLKKRRYEYESDNESEDDTNGKENARPTSGRAAPKRAKFIEKGLDVPKVVETVSVKKTPLVTPAPKKKAIKNKPLQNAASKANVDSQLKPIWVPCANPWGPPGYQEGDVVFVSPSGGYTHHETIYGGERFTFSPFGPDSDYSHTHRTPSEGFDVILLTRDPNAELPWGFTYRRHEFEGACLVTSVDPLSPAASAVRLSC